MTLQSGAAGLCGSPAQGRLGTPAGAARRAPLKPLRAFSKNSPRPLRALPKSSPRAFSKNSPRPEIGSPPGCNLNFDWPPPNGGDGGISDLGSRDALAALRLRASSPTILFPRISSTGALQPVWASKRGSIQKSLSKECRRRSAGALPAGGALQAAQLLDRRSSPRRQGPVDWQPQRRSFWSAGLVQSPLPPLDPSTECCDWATRTISGFVSPALRRASVGAGCRAARAVPRPEADLQEASFGLGRLRVCIEETGPPSTRTASLASSEGEDSPVSADPEVQVPLAATLLEVYSGYADEGAEVHDRFLRLAFRRFAVHGANEVARERLHDALLHVGFLTSTQERALDLAMRLSKFQNFDYMDFCEYVSRFAALERDAVRRRAAACLAERPDHAGGAAAADQVQQFLRSAGVYLTDVCVERARKAAGLDHVRPEDMSTNDLLLTLAACRVDEGFTKDELTAAHEIFGELEQEQRASPGGWGPMAKASDLLEGLLKFTGLYSVDYMDLLADVLPSDSAEQQGICFHEFLVWARRLRDPMMRDLWTCFRDFDSSGTGLIQLDTAISIAERFGISMLTDAVDELLPGLDLHSGSALDFHALVRFVGAARRTHGFTQAEQEEFGAAFQKFNYHGTGELTHLQVLDLLRYLGNTTNVDEVSSLIKRVDFNGNGSMDMEEFLRLMRLMREQDIRCARKSFDELRSFTGRMPAGSVRDALARLRLFPQGDVLAELLQDMPAEVCFTSFMHINDRCRVRMNLEFRKRAGFTEGTIAEIKSLWNCGGSSRRFATISELIWMFTDSHEVPVNTTDGRHQLLHRVQAAREAAVEAGALEEEASQGSTSAIGFYTFVHLIRGFVRDSEQEVIDREKEAVSFARFPNSEAAEFRRVFYDLAEEEAQKSSVCKQQMASKRQRVDKLLARLTKVPTIPDSAVVLLLKSIGLQVPSSRLNDLKRFLAKTRSRGEADEMTIQFATFLRLLRWMLDTDFAGICSVMDFRRG